MASILLVDDDVCSLHALKQLLAADGHLVCAFARGGDALSALRAAKYDVVLTDLEMPEPDGRDILRASQAKQPRPCVGVITASERVSRSELLGLGACFVMTKPLDYDRLHTALRSCPRCRPATSAERTDGPGPPLARPRAAPGRDPPSPSRSRARP